MYPIRTILLSLVVGSLLILQQQACGPTVTCKTETISDNTIDPSGSPCTLKCECNNLKFRGNCVDGTCFAVARETCQTKGAERTCRIEEGMGGECRQGIQICQPSYLSARSWGDCEPNCSACTPNTSEPCYNGPPGTLNEGRCVAGIRTCSASGVKGICEGQKSPTPEVCNGKDDDCDGVVDDNCTQSDETTQNEPAQTETITDETTQPDAGSENAPETTPAECTPSIETCNGKDDNCNGQIDEGLSCAKTWTVTTFAGSTQGYKDGKGTQAQFDNPYDLVFDKQGQLYMTDSNNTRIRKIDKDGNVTTYTGSQSGYKDGPLTQALFEGPKHLFIDSMGQFYLSDQERIRTINTSEVITTLTGSTQGYKDGPIAQALFNDPQGIALDNKGNLYIADSTNHRIRKLDTSGNVTTFAGSTQGYKDGKGTQAQFDNPHDLVFDKQGHLYVTDSSNARIRKIDKDGNVTTYAGNAQRGDFDGQGTQARFVYPHGLTIDAGGNLYVTDLSGHRIRKIDANAYVSTVAGSTQGFKDAEATQAQFYAPRGITIDTQGNLYVVDGLNHRIRKITAQ
ncbi:MAG: hypothetical protein CL920_16230 [Deltaproteobacteria bacterium]|nr:hypothetical protein [Deltaproteobacteria bacterium]MBU50236.1 hypothetical protein [Deltaproteobacteria bacterium]